MGYWWAGHYSTVDYKYRVGPHAVVVPMQISRGRGKEGRKKAMFLFFFCVAGVVLSEHYGRAGRKAKGRQFGLVCVAACCSAIAVASVLLRLKGGNEGKLCGALSLV